MRNYFELQGRLLEEMASIGHNKLVFFSDPLRDHLAENLSKLLSSCC